MIPVGSQYLATTTLNEYIRETLHLHGTKVLCREGGCGCCTVAVTYDDLIVGSKVTASLNSVSRHQLIRHGFVKATVKCITLTNSAQTFYSWIQSEMDFWYN